MIPILLDYVICDNTDGEISCFHMIKNVFYHAVPRVGDMVSMPIDGWPDDFDCDVVLVIFSELDGIVVVLKESHVSNDLAYAKEVAADLVANGWRMPTDASTG